MGYFPLCMDLEGRKVLLVGAGPQIRDKFEKLLPFGPVLLQCGDLDPRLLYDDIAFVVVGDQPPEAAVRISRLVRERGIPVNVVDDPGNSTFFFPALVTRKDVTVSVSTGGRAPGAAAYLSRLISGILPNETGEIVEWLPGVRRMLYDSLPKEQAQRLLRLAVSRAFSLGRCLTWEEILEIK